MVTVAQGRSILLQAAKMEVETLLRTSLARVYIANGVKYLASPS